MLTMLYRLRLVFICLVMSSPILLAQDSAKVLILSSKIGEVIDSFEREYYGLFRLTKNFSSAMIVQLPNGKYEARITSVTPAGQELTSVEMSEALISMLAEKIEYFEELKAGTYVMGTRHPAIQIVTKTLEGDRCSNISITQPVKLDSELLPLPRVSTPMHISSYPYVSFGYSISFYKNIIGNFEEPFDAIETKYRLQGYEIPTHKKLEMGPIHWFTCGFCLLPHLDILGATGKSTSDGPRIVYIDVLYRYLKLQSDQGINLIFGGGVASFNLEVSRLYNKARISPITYGAYSYLDHVSIHAQCIGTHILCGVEWSLDMVGIMAYGSYFKFPDISITSNENERSTANTSGGSAGVRIVVYY